MRKIFFVLFLCLAFVLPVVAAAETNFVPRNMIGSQQFRAGDSPLDRSGVPVWTYESNVIDWKDSITIRDVRETHYVWIRFQLPYMRWKQPSIFMQTYLENIEAYIDGRLIYQRGKLGRDYTRGQSRLKWLEINLPPDSGRKQLYLRVYYEDYSEMFISVCKIADKSDYGSVIEGYIKGIVREESPSLFWGFLSISLGLALFVIFVFRWKEKNYPFLSLGFFLVCGGVNVFSGLASLFIVFDPPAHLKNDMNVVSLFFYPVGLVAFFEQLFRQGKKGMLRWVWMLHLAAAVAVTVLNFARVLTVDWLFMLSQVLFIFMVADGIFIVIALASYRGREKDTGILLVATIVFITGFLYLVLFNFGLISIGFPVYITVNIIFILVLGYVLIGRVTQSEHNLSSIRQELSIARRIQSTILPESVPDAPGLKITVRYVPMAEVAGDYYDFHAVECGGLGLLLADVSGHGVPAALIASMLKISFSAQSPNAADPAAVLCGMNQNLCGKLESQFVTAGYLYLDRGNSKLVYSSAAHPALLLYSAKTGAVEELKPRGMVIGVFPNMAYRNVERQVEKGDRILLYTDGIIECSNHKGVEFGEEELGSYIRANAGLPQEDFADGLIAELRRFSENRGGFADDISLLVIDIV